MSSDRHAYTTPALLQPLELLDALELCGSTSAAAVQLNLSQPTVSRRHRAVAADLGLQRLRKPPRHQLRYAPNTCLSLLRRAYQWHRLQAGAWRLGVNPWQRPLAAQLSRLRPVAAAHEHPLRWLHLLNAGVVDGALLSGLDLALLEPGWDGLGDQPVPWRDALLLPLVALPLGLLLPPGSDGPSPWAPVWVPAEQRSPGLAAAVRQRQWRCLHAPLACRNGKDWGALLQERPMPALVVEPMAELLLAQLEGWSWRPLADGATDPQWLLTEPQLWPSDGQPEQLAEAWRQALAANQSAGA